MQGFSIGADGYITRPIGNQELIARVGAFARIQMRNRHLRQRAEAIAEPFPKPEDDLSVDEIHHIIQELQVHQAELEIQNDELQRTQVELETSRDRFSALYHQAPVGYASLDEAAIIRDANQTLADMIGTSLSQLIGSALSRWLSEADRPVFHSLFPTFYRYPEGKTLDIHLTGGPENSRIISLQGSRSASRASSPELGPRNGLIRVAAVDVTRQRMAEKSLQESETRYRTLFEEAIDGIGLFDAETGKLAESNNAFAALMGIEKPRLLSNHAFLLKPEPHEKPAIHLTLADLKSVSGEILAAESHDASGQLRHIGLKANLLKLQDQQLIQAILRDITDLKCAERTLQEKQQQLEALNQSLENRVQEAVQELRRKDQLLIHQNRMAAMGEMIGNIAHQWRQPLNALGMLIANIKDAYQFNEMNDAYMDKAASDGYRLVQKMSTTISDFFNFFQPNKEIVAFSARRQIEEAIALVQASFINNNIAIHFETVHDAKLLGFPNEYSQVLLNLMSNAKDAMLEHQTIGGRVDIHIEVVDNMGCVTVRDNAGGIPEEILGKIFDPYFTTKQRGIGIGLYMSQMIITDNMNGGIFVRNVENGAEFTVSVPLADEATPKT